MTGSLFDSFSSWITDNIGHLVTSAIIIVVAVVLNFLVRRAIRRFVERFVRAQELRRERALDQESPANALSSSDQQATERLHAVDIAAQRAGQRAQTLGSLLRYATTIVIFAIAALMVLAELGVNIGPLLAGAGIVGIALGFGAQSLVKDFLSGAFMLMEDQYGVGDVIDVGEATGTVERVTLRVTTLRDVDGTVWYVPNGEVRRVGNKSKLWSRIVLDVEVAYDTDISQASEVIKRVADVEWKAQTRGATIIEEPELWGVEQFGPSAIVLRLAVKTLPGEQWFVGRALRAGLKEAFDEAGIVIPFPQQTVWLQGAGESREDAGERGQAEPDDHDQAGPDDHD
ncbi:MAG: mechanosensitive ion channel family protein [Thermoleophilia bacterium]|nr:mechanosensitive ion channel family protein [Thermoleophilia bacterium]